MSQFIIKLNLLFSRQLHHLPALFLVLQSYYKKIFRIFWFKILLSSSLLSQTYNIMLSPDLKYQIFESPVLRCFQIRPTYSLQNNGKPKFENIYFFTRLKRPAGSRPPISPPISPPIYLIDLLKFPPKAHKFFVHNDHQSTVRSHTRNFPKASNLTYVFWPNVLSKFKMQTRILLKELCLLYFAQNIAQILY